MNTIILKYLQFFCVAVLFDNIRCEQLLLKDSKDDYLLNRNVSCTIMCMDTNPEKVSNITQIIK